LVKRSTLKRVPRNNPTIPERLDSVIRNHHLSVSVLSQPLLVVGRQLEMLNVLIGFEQVNKYSIKDANGHDVGFIAEEEKSWTSGLLRQLLHTRRAFNAVVLNQQGQPILRVNYFLIDHLD
jgi:hypothetical protein